jgi:hypothetical protein
VCDRRVGTGSVDSAVHAPLEFCLLNWISINEIPQVSKKAFLLSCRFAEKFFRDGDIGCIARAETIGTQGHPPSA